MSSTYGKNLKITIFGQSHSAAIGVTAEGLPAGFKVDMAQLNAFLARRAPGNSPLSTPRKEADAPEFLSGMVADTLCGAPLTAIIRNTNTRSGDYENLRDLPRPGHADFTAQMKFGGAQDVAGGGHFSGRLTAPLCIAGGIAKQILAEKGIAVSAHIAAIAGVEDDKFDPLAPDMQVNEKEFPVLCDEAGEKMKEAVLSAKADGDSVGGIIECAVTGIPAGVGDPMFDGMENRIAAIVFGIPAIKGVEFGAGFAAANMRGSENNDAYTVKDGKIITCTNHAGGILGGITTGMPLIFRCAVKPTPSIAKAQQSVRLSTMTEDTLEIHGRHDPCIVPRAVPCVEAAAAIAVYDALKDANML